MDAWIKRNLCDWIASGHTTTDAARALGVDLRVVLRWRKEDADFERAYTSSIEALAQIKLDALLDLHLTAGDAKAAANALKGNAQWLAWSKPEQYGPKAAGILDSAGAAELFRLIQAAQSRIPLDPSKLIDVTPSSDMGSTSAKPGPKDPSKPKPD